MVAATRKMSTNTKRRYIARYQRSNLLADREIDHVHGRQSEDMGQAVISMRLRVVAWLAIVAMDIAAFAMLWFMFS